MSSVDTKIEKLSGEKLNFNKITGPDMVVSELSSLAIICAGERYKVPITLMKCYFSINMVILTISHILYPFAR